jgi:hypothetical protein
MQRKWKWSVENKVVIGGQYNRGEILEGNVVDRDGEAKRIELSGNPFVRR